MEPGNSLESTATWAVATVVAGLILISLFFEHILHLLSHFLEKRKRKTLNQALNDVKTELRNLGLMTLLLTMASQPISKICIPRSLEDKFQPCKRSEIHIFDEAPTCEAKGKVSIVSEVGVNQLQLLIFTMAVVHVISSIATLGLGEVKIKKWKYWEEETKTMEYQLSNDPRRLTPSRETSFGRRHLNMWSKHPFLLWLVCCIRQFTGSVSRADYFALRHGFLTVHFDTESNYDFLKFVRRSVDHDFKAMVKISTWVWIYAIIFLFLNAHEFMNHYWTPVIPLVILLIVGMKLEVIITKMCLKSSRETVFVQGTLCVEPDNNLFWFSQPKLLLHLIHFVLIQNSFHLAFFAWAWYQFGFHSCFHRGTDEITLGIGVGLIVHFLCAYVTLPLYALVTQMGSTMKESIFADRVIEGLKNWRNNAKGRIEEKRNSNTPSLPSTPSATSAPSRDFWPLIPSDMHVKSDNKNVLSSREALAPIRTKVLPNERALAPIRTKVLTNERASTSSNTSDNWRQSASAPPKFKYPSGRHELLEVQRVVELMMHSGPSSSRFGEASFRMWKRQGSSEPSTSSK